MPKLLTALGVLCFLSFVFAFSLRLLIIYKAEEKAQSFFSQSAEIQSDERALVYALTKQVYETFDHKVTDTSALGRLRSYLSTTRLPDWVRLPTGAIETLRPMGWCGNAARTLIFVLDQHGIKSRQWNMVSSRSAHAAVIATLSDGQQVLLDPFFGVISQTRLGELVGPSEAKERILSGEDFKNVILPLSPRSDIGFYKNLSEMIMSAQGDALHLEAHISDLKGEALILGKINGDAQDVKSKSLKLKWTPHWSYIGHKHDRGWVRHLKSDHPVKVTFVLTEEPYRGALTSNRPPVIDGKNLSWSVGPNEGLVFTDGLAKPSFSRMRSYVPVDQIIIEPFE